jgi:hypothetical protein
VPRVAQSKVQPSIVEPRPAAKPAPAPPAPPVDAGTRTDAGAPELEFRHVDYYPLDETIELRPWLSDHGVAGGFREEDCWDARDRVGVPPSPGLVCERRTTRPPKVTSRIYRLEGARLRLVWEGIVATYANWLELTPFLAENGAELVVRDRHPGSCDAAFAEFREKAQSGIRMDFGPALREGCASLGTHTWSGNRYVKMPASSE